MPTAFKEFEEAQRVRHALTTRPLGVIQVPVDEIVGSVGRARYFPRGLQSGRGLTPSRVRRLVDALRAGQVLPAVHLYRLGHEYYIVDGHHRVAAARITGQQEVDAEVVAFLPEGHTLEDVVARERVQFEQQTAITRIVLHELGQYPKLFRWIEDYRRVRGKGSIRSAAREWYTQIYLPAVEAIRAKRLLRFFPGRSAGDVFVYVGDHKWILSKAAGRDIGMTTAIESFADYLATGDRHGAFVRWLDGLAARFRRLRRKPTRRGTPRSPRARRM